MSDQAGRPDLLGRFYEAWNGPNPVDDTLPMLHEEFEYVNPESAVEPGTRHGHAGWLNVGESAEKAFSAMSLEPYETIEAVDDQLLVLTIFRACGRDSGVELEVPEQHLWAFRDGKVVRLAWFHDERAARRAAGLR